MESLRPIAESEPLVSPTKGSLPKHLLLLAIVVVCFVSIGLGLGYPWDEVHPALNALLNFSSALFLCFGLRAIKLGRRSFHKDCMLSAFTCSSIFLISYLARYALSGTHRFAGEGLEKVFYLFILFTHMILAMVSLPMIFGSIYFAWRGQFDLHRRLAKWTWCVWAYVSVTGVVVYFMLYQL